MSHSIQKSVAKTVTTVMTFFIIIIFILLLFFTFKLSQSYRTELADSVSEFAVQTINADDAWNYLTLRETDSAYSNVLKKLCNYQKSNSKYVKRISLVSFSNTTGNYIYDTAENNLGDRLEYDVYTDSVREALLNGRESWNVQRTGSIFVYRPLRTIDDKLAGYLIIELTDSFYKTYLLLSVAVAIILMTVALVLVVLMMRRLRRMLFQPIQRFTDVALSFTGGGTETEISELFSPREDEIGQLGKAIQKMFLDISSGAENLNKAIYEANHDGMTQVLNKSSYMTMEERFKNCSSICVIYFDVNNLKLINDTLGHEQGDYVIKQAANYIRNFLTPTDYCFRMGGDEFLMVMTECSFRAIDVLVEKLDSDSPHILNPQEEKIRCALSYGYAYAKGNYSYETLLAEAEENMYTKKAELKALMNMPDR